MNIAPASVRRWFVSLGILLLGVVSLVPVVPVTAAGVTYTNVACPKDKGILGFPAWYEGLKCTKSSDANDGYLAPTLSKVEDFWIIAMNIVQWLVLAVGYVSLYFIILSGFKYMTAAGEPQKTKDAISTLTNAITGLVIALAAVALVRTIQGAVAGKVV